MREQRDKLLADKGNQTKDVNNFYDKKTGQFVDTY